MNHHMTCTNKLNWLIPVAAAIGLPLALLWAGTAGEIAETLGRFSDGTILAFAAAANALTVMP